MPGARTRSVESPCVSYDGFSLNRTEGAEGTEAIVTSDFTLPTSYFILRKAPTADPLAVDSRLRQQFFLQKITTQTIDKNTV